MIELMSHSFAMLRFATMVARPPPRFDYIKPAAGGASAWACAAAFSSTNRAKQRRTGGSEDCDPVAARGSSTCVLNRSSMARLSSSTLFAILHTSGKGSDAV